MDWDLQKSPEPGYQFENSNEQYVSRLSTILVASVQEVRDKISQIEYIFCSQLYPNFQSKHKRLHNISPEAWKAAEDEWNKKEKELLRKIKKLRIENQQVLDENLSLKLEIAGPLKEHEEKCIQLMTKQQVLEKTVNRLENQLVLKSKEVDDGKAMQNRYLQVLESKSSVIVDKEMQLREHELRASVLLADIKGLENKVHELQQELKEKTKEVAMGKDFQEDLLKKIEGQANKILNDKENHEKDKKLLTTKLEHLEENVYGLQEELRKKTEEVEKGRKLQEQLIKQIDLIKSEMSENEQKMKEHEGGRNLLLEKVKGLEGKVQELQVELIERRGEVTGGKKSYEKLLQNIELKAAELASEKNKARDWIAAYKSLKSQYNHLRLKNGLTIEEEDTPPQHKIEEEKDVLRHNQNPTTLPDCENNNQDTSTAAWNTNKLKKKISLQEKLDDEKGVKLAKNSSSHSPGFIPPSASKGSVEAKSAPLAGVKRPASPHWRETRSHQRQGGPDPHDDFLDTPLENIRGNLNRAMKEEVREVQAPVPENRNLVGSNDETQDMNAAASSPKRQQQMQVPKPGTTSYKYVEPVRKKAERENLKGVECNQCKKFYDAVLPDGGGKVSTDGSNKTPRCEHHDGVSRHRYRYVPPLTPEGFWNIGFESEM